MKEKRKKIEIINAGPDHIPDILKLWAEMIDYHKDFNPIYRLQKNAQIYFEKHVRKLIDSMDSQVLLALDDGISVGYSISMISNYPPILMVDKYGLITDIGVRSDYRRKGIGGLMLEKIFAWFKESGINRIELRVVSQNIDGISFWEKHGFKDFMHLMYINN